MKRMLGLVVAAVLAVGGLVIWSVLRSPPLPDPITAGTLANARVVSDIVDCDFSPETCSRYVVIAPVGITTTQLMSEVSSYAQGSLKWQRVAHPSRASRAYGTYYATKPFGNWTSDSGGYIATTAAELDTWRRQNFAYGQTPPDTQAVATQKAMAETPTGILFNLIGSICGTPLKCQT